ETTFKNYNSIEFFPQKFTEYLLSSEVGFTKCEVIGMPYHHSKGFQRPIQLFTKAVIMSSRETDDDDTIGQSNTNTPSHSIVSGSSQTPSYTAVRMSTREIDDDEVVGVIYTAVGMSVRETDEDDAGAESVTSTPSHAVETSNSRPPVYTTVSMSARDTDDDTTVQSAKANDAGVEEKRNHCYSPPKI
ncbi:hypothetical protein L9F63_019006, partial [Diploptera punctata]